LPLQFLCPLASTLAEKEENSPDRFIRALSTRLKLNLVMPTNQYRFLFYLFLIATTNQYQLLAAAENTGVLKARHRLTACAQSVREVLLTPPCPLHCTRQIFLYTGQSTSVGGQLKLDLTPASLLFTNQYRILLHLFFVHNAQCNLFRPQLLISIGFLLS
jgi:hypothetical protein